MVVRFNATPEVSTSTAVSSPDTWYSRNQLSQFQQSASFVSRRFRSRCASFDSVEETDVVLRDEYQHCSAFGPRGLELRVDVERQKHMAKVVKTVVQCQYLLLARKPHNKARIAENGRRTVLSESETRRLASVSEKLTANAAEVARQEALSDYCDAYPVEATKHMTEKNALLLHWEKASAFAAAEAAREEAFRCFCDDYPLEAAEFMTFQNISLLQQLMSVPRTTCPLEAPNMIREHQQTLQSDDQYHSTKRRKLVPTPVWQPIFHPCICIS